MAQFRYNCLSEFLSNRSTFVWGGAMVLRRADVEQNMYGLLDWWRKGGYSDDMQVQACAQDAGRMIATPLSAIFPNELKKDVTFDYCWGFLRRQNWVRTELTSSYSASHPPPPHHRHLARRCSSPIPRGRTGRAT